MWQDKSLGRLARLAITAYSEVMMIYLCVIVNWKPMQDALAGPMTLGLDTSTQQAWRAGNSSSIIAKCLILLKLTLPFIVYLIFS